MKFGNLLLAFSLAYGAHRAGRAISARFNPPDVYMPGIDGPLYRMSGGMLGVAPPDDGDYDESVSLQDVTRELHEIHNEAVHNWRDAGRPLEGPLYEAAVYVQQRLLSAGYLILDSDLVGEAVKNYRHYIKCLGEWRAAGSPNRDNLDNLTSDSDINEVALLGSVSIAQGRVLIAGFSIAPDDRVRPNWLDQDQENVYA